MATATAEPTTNTETPAVEPHAPFTWEAVALDTLPAIKSGANAKPLSDDDRKIAEAVGAIIAAGQAAKAGAKFTDRAKAEAAARGMVRLLNKANLTLADGTIVKMRVLANDDGTFGYAILTGPKPTPRVKKGTTPATT